MLLVGLALIQSPGMLAADTKFDLAVDPAQFLARASHLWEPQGAFGQVQNQAYGYLWPMGPFFLLGSLVDLPGWVVQRLWMALVMCVALSGSARVARSLGVRSDLACLLGGFAFALSPRMLTTLGPISIEAWPSALVPWVLLPLVNGSRSGSARRAAALSATAVAMVGGVNAAATFAVLPLGVLWLLTRAPGPRRRTMLIWWPFFTLLATLWWLVPLFLLGAYSPPFLDFIESASNTTFPTTLFDALRGTSDWVPYVDRQSRAGNDLLREIVLILDSGVVLFLGSVGLLRRGTPERLFLGLGLVTGLLLVTMGHVGSVQGWTALELRNLLDGALAPLRNVHKFDPVVRLPLVLGLAWLVDAVLARLRSGVAGLERVNASVVVGTAVLAVLGTSLPALGGRVTPAGALVAVPDYWKQAASWLGRSAGDGTALLLPGSSFASYVWGSPRDEPLQFLAPTRWAVRNAVPLVPAGNIRVLDEIERRFSQGLGSAGLASYLRRAGVSHLVVRNDLARSADVTDPVLVHQALATTPGVRRVARFGPVVGGEAHLRGRRARVLVNGGWQNQFPAVEIFEVDGVSPQAVTTDRVTTVVGGPEDLLDLSALGFLGDEPAQLAVDASRGSGDRFDPAAPLILTDGLRAVERNFGRVHDGASATLTPEDPRRLGNPTRDYLLGGEVWSTRAEVTGVRSVSASSSMADASAVGVVEPGQLPSAAADANPETAWVADSFADEVPWWRVDFKRARPVGSVTVTAGPDDREVVHVRTAHRTSATVAVAPGASRTVRVDDGRTGWLRVEDVSGRGGRRMALTEVETDALSADRVLVVPPVPQRWGDPDAIVLRAVDDARDGCATVDGAVRCVPGRDIAGEEEFGFARRVTVHRPLHLAARLQVRPRAGAALTRLLLQDQFVGVSSSSQGVPDVRASAVAAVDGDEGTTWIADEADVNPLFELSWIGTRPVRALRLSVAADSAARLPEELTLIWPGGRRDVQVRNGVVSFPAVRTDRLALRVREAEPAVSLGFDSTRSSVPVGIGELRVVGLPLVPVKLRETAVRYPCGSGPSVTVAGRTLATAVTATPSAMYAGATLPAELCGAPGVSLSAGPNEIRAEASAAFVPDSLVLTRGRLATAQPRSAPMPAPTRSTDPVHRTVSPLGTGTVLQLHQNANAGWLGSQRGRRLAPVVLDGWQQGWSLPATGAEVSLSYRPDRFYRLGLAAGALALLVLLGVVVVPRHRWRGSAAPPVGRRRAGAPTMTVVAIATGGLLAGWVGAVVAALAAFACARPFTERMRDTSAWVLGALVLPAATAYALRPWGGSAGWAGQLSWPHYLVVAVAAAVLVSAAERLPFPTSRWRRIPGRSTSW